MRLHTKLTEQRVEGADIHEELAGTAFEMKPLSGAQRQPVWMGFAKDGVFPAELQQQAIFQSVTNWEGFENEDGEPLKFTRKNLLYLDYHHLIALFNKVWEISELSEDERKNS